MSKRNKNNRKSPWFAIIILALAAAFIYFTVKITLQTLEDFNNQFTESSNLYEKNMNWAPEDFSSTGKRTVSIEELNEANSHAEEESFTKSGLEIPNCQGILIDDENDDHEVHTYNGFTLCYRESYEVAEWVAYSLTREELDRVTGRTDDFRPDTKITTGSAQLSDYRGSGYDRGHLAPAADMEWSLEACKDSFLLSNMTPQTAQLNRGLWKTLEEQVRTWANRYGEVFVVTGPILEKPASKYNTIGMNKVAVPEFFYKVLIADVSDAQDGSSLIGCAFILPNEKCSANIWDYAVSIDEVEERTGIDFFHLIPNSTEDELEKNLDFSSWKQ